MTPPVPSSALPLQRLYHFETHAPGQGVFTHPMGGFLGWAGVELTWGEVMDQARRMAAHLRQLGLPPGSRITILSPNCAHRLSHRGASSG